MMEKRYRRDNRTRYSKDHHEGKQKDAHVKRDNANTCPNEPSFQKLRVNINSFLSPTHKPYSFAGREESISRERKSSNFNRSPPFYCGLPGKTGTLLFDVKVVTGNDDCSSSSTEVVEDGFLCYLNQVAYGLNIPLTFFQKGVMNALKSCPGQLNCNVFEMMKTEPNPKGTADTSSLLDIVSREGIELTKVLGALGIRREKRLNSIVEKVQRAHQNQAMATSGSAYDDILKIPACLSVAWKSAAEVLKVADADCASYEAEKSSLADQLKERTALCEQLQKGKDVDLTLTGKYCEIIIPGDNASLVAEQSLAPPVADDTTKEVEVVRLRGKVCEMEKALCRASDSINHIQQGQKAMRILFFNIKKEDKRVHAQLENGLRHARDELELCKDHNTCLEMEKVEYNKLLQSSDKRVTLLEACLLDTQKLFQMSQSRLKKYLTPKRGKRASKIDHEQNDKVENMWFAKGNEGGGASTTKPRAEESKEEEVEDLLPHTRHKTRPQEENDHLYHQSVVTNNTDLLKKQDAEIHHMRERLKKLNWDLREARDS
ncbi:hypothetical protein GIB67_000081 [Kingdonia uniflora]|uniref:Uncharacterized protein n=1 Tax=Kingdonia uniflora TaxID=39325 RepID=A0A7J7N9W8_9MAGN|nr:hypothetical protein GIB67_000081 [Kingdonia uniflora]